MNQKGTRKSVKSEDSGANRRFLTGLTEVSTKYQTLIIASMKLMALTCLFATTAFAQNYPIMMG